MPSRPRSLKEVLRKGGAILKASAEAVEQCESATKTAGKTLERSAMPILVDAFGAVNDAINVISEGAGGSLEHLVKVIREDGEE